MTTLLQVALGGALGAVLRYLASIASVHAFGHHFPWGTLFVNVVGSFVIGVFAVLLVARGGQGWSPLLMTGLMGGFTTFSAFSLDAAGLMGRGESALAAGYVGASLALALIGVGLGLWVGRFFQ